MTRRSVQFLWLLFLTLLARPGYGQSWEDALKRDFQALAGVVIMASAGVYLIDVDAGKGVREGDLFAVVQPGEKIVHPVSGQVLGSLDRVKGYLQVSQVKSGYSYARPLGKGEAFERGDRIQRFEQMEALFWDYPGGGEAVYQEVKRALPGLNWRSYAEAQASRPASLKAAGDALPGLVFVLADGRLEVRDGRLAVLRSYPLTAAAPTAGAPASAAAGAASAIVPAPPLAAVVPKAAPTAGASGIVQAERGDDNNLWVSPNLKGEPVGLAVADFDRDGQRETAIAFQDRIELVRLVGRQWQSVGQVDLGSRLKALAMDAVDLDGDGIQELYVSAVDGPELSSLVVDCTGGVCRIGIRNLPWFLRVVEMPGRGPLLLGQAMAADKVDFASDIFEMRREGQTLQRGPKLELPKSFNLYGFLPLAQSGGSPLYAGYDANSGLQVVSAEGENLWRGGDRFGGRESFVERIDPEVFKEQMTKRLYLDAALKPGAGGEILVPVNLGPSWLGNYRSFEKSQLKALRWDGRSLEELWHTREQNGYLSDFALADVDNDGAAEIVMTVLYSHGGFMSKPRANLLVFELP